ncbi:NADH-quinone oxidoreductase subunit N [Desulfobacca acetoxidans]|uniref:NADH-quinone oxidoreductase subunit N n=1 Tax=Desulfobacca acetoxidans (strain ATCC 700848 / DSM 11109 / ASRB2) TaxID=880072 RepID=F2NHF5_DESAR|nr:NADH-quinone oxidoreductase subunit N [Desulfobacca acetoxidans]AEB09071.1 NAD(P)H-quinone oxidoreductase subunit 2 [Desulfobacca acetoxidans DSM 11109]
MNAALFAPELYYLLMGLALFFRTLRQQVNVKRDFQIFLALAGGGVLVSSLCLFQQGELFFAAYKVDLFSQIFKAALALGLFLVALISHNLADVEERSHAEFYLFLTTCTVGMMMLVSAVELLTVYVSLELASYSLYILVPMRRGDGIDVEAGIKYLFIGAVSSCFMLFGLSYIFGAVHSTYIADVMMRLPALVHSPVGLLGIVLSLAGFFFKLSIFPIHFWAPDVYQGGTNQLVAYIATASKAAAVAVLLRFAALGGPYGYSFAKVLVFLSIISMTLGNLVAIIQKDFKRMLAYSSIAHAGYIMMGILTLSEPGYTGVIYYAVAYLIMNFTCFMVLSEVAGDGRDLKIVEFAGLYQRSPLLALALMLGLFSLAGVPPSIGFTGKLLIFTSAMSQGYFWLVLIGAVNGTISLYYYLKVVYAAYFLEPGDLPVIQPSNVIRLTSVGLIGIIIGFGVFPNQVVELARMAVKYVL